MIPFLCKLGPKKAIFKRFYQLFFRTAGFQHKLLKLIVSSNIFHWESVKESKLGVDFEPNLGQIRFNVVKKTKELIF